MTEFGPLDGRVEFHDQKVPRIPLAEPDFFELIARVDPEAVSADPRVHHSNAFRPELDAALRLLWVSSCNSGRSRCALWWLRRHWLFGRLYFVS